MLSVIDTFIYSIYVAIDLLKIVSQINNIVLIDNCTLVY